MATYKAEFLSHYYEKRWRPRTAYAFGWIQWWARLGSLMPRVTNFVTHAPGLGRISKLLSGMALEREVPEFASETFRSWFARTRRDNDRADGKDRVLLWPDTFNDHFHPDTAIAACELLESAGFDVVVPREAVCCGRPLYDYGFLTLARRTLLNVLTVLREPIRAGTPVVVLEPSCAAVFRDEMVNLLPHDQDAKRLASQVHLLGDFVASHRDRFDLPRCEADVLFHGHCHQKAIFGTRGDVELLTSLGARVQAPDSGCCGMAGSFGFEASHYEISEKVGERVLLPAVRQAAADTVIVADGFSCREQVAQLTNRRARHVAEVLRAAQRGAALQAPAVPAPQRRWAAAMALAAGAIATISLVVWRQRSRARGIPANDRQQSQDHRI
jgi:Fe-S oxidoreductase